jgi:nitrate reductase (NAD(P)H)
VQALSQSLPGWRSASGCYSWEQVRLHDREDSCWLVVKGDVYDVTKFLSVHPAGKASILRHAATEASVHFGFHSSEAHKIW